MKPPVRTRQTLVLGGREVAGVTYSILGREAANGNLGVAAQSGFPGVGSLVPYGEAEVGVVATQGFGNPRHGTAALRLLSCGAAGGDIRGQQSAALLVLRRHGGYGALDDRHVVISVYDHPRPIAELIRCSALIEGATTVVRPGADSSRSGEAGAAAAWFVGVRVPSHTNRKA